MEILIADDDLITRKILSQTLANEGFKPIAVDNGKDALDILRKDNVPKIAILDWQMPELTGIDVIKELKIEISVQDNGTGINEDIIAKIFNHFFYLKNSV